MIYVGTRIYGYCGGAFGEIYRDKRIEAVGANWVVARDNYDIISFATFDDTEQMERLVKEWQQ